MQLDPTAAPLSGISVDLGGIKRVFPGPVIAIDSIDQQIVPGEFVAIVGPSGCGKSTLLRIIDGLDKPTSGQVMFHGQPITSPSPKVGVIFQTFALIPWKTVLGNVLMAIASAPIQK